MHLIISSPPRKPNSVENPIRRQAVAPSQGAPEDDADHGGGDRLHVDRFRFHNPLADGHRHSRSRQRSRNVEDGGHQDRRVGTKDARRYDCGDCVGSVREAIDEFCPQHQKEDYYDRCFRHRLEPILRGSARHHIRGREAIILSAIAKGPGATPPSAVGPGGAAQLSLPRHRSRASPSPPARCPKRR